MYGVSKSATWRRSLSETRMPIIGQCSADRHRAPHGHPAAPRHLSGALVAPGLEVSVISRQWCGVARTNQAENYVAHLRTEVFPSLGKLPGFVSASILCRPQAEGVEFLVVTHWDSLDAIAKFAGADLEAAVVSPHAATMFIEYDRRVRHYEIIE